MPTITITHYLMEDDSHNIIVDDSHIADPDWAESANSILRVCDILIK